jgi:molybdopterin-containing oxidoreductase family iron-sulfur binding subunit
MAIDLNTCTGCNSCQVACRQENNIPTYGPEEKYEAGRIEWMSMLWDEPEDELKLPQLMPFPCQQCQDAPCIKVCPVGATFKDSEGIIQQVSDRCIGCRYCMVACPYDRRFFNWEEPKFEGSLVQMLNPDVGTRTAGIVEKCTFCSHRITKVREEARLEGREMVDSDHQQLTACASACPADAITFGDLNDPESAVAKLKRGPNVFHLLEHLGTDPSVFYLKRERKEDS